MKKKIVIEIDENLYNAVKDPSIDSGYCANECYNAVQRGTLLPKGCGRLISEKYLLDFLRCEDYETCTWRNCSECNREKCIKESDIKNAQAIIEAESEE